MGALPGFIPLYIGMPVILRMRNLSTDLGITNGSQGYVRDIVTGVSKAGFTYCKCAIVEFPDSKVTLSGLPKGYFPITLISWTFTTTAIINGVKLRITRQQLPIQPAFAVTGHSAQGKTLPKILAGLHEGGFRAYVAASCARTREGLCITERVSLRDLNKPVPHDLLMEVRCLKALEHNSYVWHGFSSEPYIDVPDAEAERSMEKLQIYVTKFEIDVGTGNTAKKRKSPEFPSVKNDNNAPPSKRVKSAPRQESFLISRVYPAPLVGCTWSADNWSCAYDAVFMVTFNIYCLSKQTWQTAWNKDSEIRSALGASFEILHSTHLASSDLFNFFRDQLRDYLSNLSQTAFPRFGQWGTSAAHIFEILAPRETRNLHMTTSSLSCTNGCIHKYVEQSAFKLSSIWIPTAGENQVKMVQQWMEAVLKTTCDNIEYKRHLFSCETCSQPNLTFQITFTAAPPLLCFEMAGPTTMLPDKVLNIGSEQYTLKATIYLGNYHFTSRFIFEDNSVWNYDGRVNNGKPVFEAFFNNDLDLTKHGSRFAHVFVYTITSNLQ